MRQRSWVGLPYDSGKRDKNNNNNNNKGKKRRPITKLERTELSKQQKRKKNRPMIARK